MPESNLPETNLAETRLPETNLHDVVDRDGRRSGGHDAAPVPVRRRKACAVPSS